MTFKHKLSHRLALLKDRRLAIPVAALAAAVVFACETPLPVSSTGGTIADLVIAPKNVTLHLNQTVEFTAAAFMNTGDSANVSVTWSTTYGSVTDMGTSSNGRRHYGQYKAAGTAPGQYKVVATGAPGGVSDTATVNVTLAPVAALSVAPSSATIVMGATTQLQATTTDSAGNVLSGRTVTWSSNNGSVATVSGSGLVTGAGTGSATITATSEGQSGTSSITVSTVPVASVTVSPTSLSLQTGQTGQLTATPRDANGNPLSGRVVTWSSSDTTIAKVSGSGLVTARAGGSATVTATSEGQSGAATVTVTFVPVASVTVSPTSLSLQTGQTGQLTATPRDANGNPLSGRVVTWSSSDTTIAKVSGSGLVTARAGGSATVTATSEGQSGTAAVTVTSVPVASVTVSPASATLPVGQTTQLTATPKDANGNPLTGRVVTWASNNTTDATVSGSGMVSAKAAGSAMITATSEGQNGTSSITVTQVPVATVSVTPTSAAVQPGQTTQLTAATKDASGNVLTGRVVTWSTSSATIATVSTSGLVTGVANGTALITATSESKTGSAAIAVGTPPPPAGCAPTGSGVCRYVDAVAGNDGNPGDSAHPFKTVQQAANVVNAGDMVIVRNGVYTGDGNAVLSIQRGGTAGALVVFRSQNKWGAVLDGQNNLSADVLEIGTDHVRVEGFEMKGSNHYGVDPSTGTNDIQIAGNNIHDVGRYCESSGIGLSAIDAYSNNMIIEGNWVHDIGRFAAGENGCQPGNDYWMNHDHGVYNGQGTNIIIRNNVFYNITRGWAIQRYGSSVDQLYIVNNTFAFPNPNRDGQIILAATTTNLFIENNIFYLPGQNVGISGTQSGSIIDHNLSTGAVGGGGTGTNIENTDPLFVNPSTLDFRLQAGSPAINAGLALNIVLNDFLGTLRPQGAGWDIGAYEFK
ncbi:MAG: hypothetical protein DMD33_02890 [Gemmatimonadetes bacterium]|nr:MAG: hypothetical protein DMD33_02890 [Gemmatimonadota bacterium]